MTATKKVNDPLLTDDKVNEVPPAPALEPVTVPAMAYKNIYGSFGIITRKGDKISSVTWEGCRDRFQSSTENGNVVDFLFFHNDGVADHVIDFVRTVEKVVRLDEKDALEFRKTNNPNILYVKMGDWWKYRLRRSLLTALLRCGQSYTDRTAKGFEKALYSQYYLAQTKPAVEQFLKGRTGSKLKKRSGFSGWYAQFVNQNEAVVRQTLVKVVPKPPEPEVPAGEQPADAAAPIQEVAATT